MGSPPTGAPNTDGYVKIGDFRLISLYVPETVQERQRYICALSSGAVFSDPTLSRAFLVSLERLQLYSLRILYTGWPCQIITLQIRNCPQMGVIEVT